MKKSIAAAGIVAASLSFGARPALAHTNITFVAGTTLGGSHVIAPFGLASPVVNPAGGGSTATDGTLVMTNLDTVAYELEFVAAGYRFTHTLEGLAQAKEVKLVGAPAQVEIEMTSPGYPGIYSVFRVTGGH